MPLTSASIAADLIFPALAGAWKISRRISSRLASAPSGSLSGVAIFLARQPNAPGYQCEYVYAERGTFEMDGGIRMEAKRGYVYRFGGSNGEKEEGRKQADCNSSTTSLLGPAPSTGCPVESEEGGTEKPRSGISAWFVVQPDRTCSSNSNPEEVKVEKFFHSLEFDSSDSLSDLLENISIDRVRALSDAGGMRRADLAAEEDEMVKKITARGSHLCCEDFYEVEYVFYLRAEEEMEDGKGKAQVGCLEGMKITYVVRGPKKDYTSETWYFRDEEE